MVKNSHCAVRHLSIVAGVHMRDWWIRDEPPCGGGLDRQESRSAGRRQDPAVRYGWANPKPEQELVSIDYASEMTRAAPFSKADSPGKPYVSDAPEQTTGS